METEKEWGRSIGGVEKDWTTQAGLRAVIVNMGHRCGYVGVPADHARYGVNYGAPGLYEIDVHGGLTYADKEENYPVQSDLWWFGYDCAHYGDDNRTCSLEYCVNECESLAQQLVALVGGAE